MLLYDKDTGIQTDLHRIIWCYLESIQGREKYPDTTTEHGKDNKLNNVILRLLKVKNRFAVNGNTLDLNV